MANSYSQGHKGLQKGFKVEPLILNSLISTSTIMNKLLLFYLYFKGLMNYYWGLYLNNLYLPKIVDNSNNEKRPFKITRYLSLIYTTKDFQESNWQTIQ